MNRTLRPKRKFLVLLGGVAATGVLLIGCGGGGVSANGSSAKPVRGGSLQVSQSEEIVTMAPLEATDASSINVVSQINEPLYRVNAQGKNEPWLLSKSKESQGGRVWTLTLRDGVEFSDGKPMTSADVLFTLEKARKSAYWSSLFEGVKSITAPSPSTIVITNAEPAPELPAILSQWSFGIVPNNYGGLSAKEFAQDPTGTGPFMLGPWKHGETLVLKENPHYWRRGQPYLNEVVLHTIANPESRVSQLKGGQLDVIDNPPWAQISALESTPGVEVGHYPLGYSETLILNTRIPLFQNAKAREAVYLAIDREGLVDAVLSGHGEPGASWIPPTVPFHNSDLAAPKQDLAKAKMLLGEAVAEGASPKFTILDLNENPFWGQAAQVVEQNLEEAGFEVTLKPTEEAVAGEEAASGKFDAVTFQVYDAIPSPSEMVGFYNGNEGGFSGADTSQTTKLTEEALAATEETKRSSSWYKVQELIDAEHAVFPVAYAPYSWATREGVSGFQVTSTGIPWFAETGLSAGG